MNFKKYHVSKNLYKRQYMFAYIDSTGKIIENAANVLAYTEVEPNTTYTVSADLMATNGNRIAVFNTAPTANLTGSNVISISQKAYLFTITTNNDTKYIAWHTSFSDTKRFSQFLQTSMLNEGSTPLPYEPYSSEVWHDIPHYIMGTSTDTITTLPAVLYPNAVTATVGLKGQMKQIGIPTPQNPIQPQECGELEQNIAIIDNKSDTINNGYYKDIRLTDVLKAGTYTVSYSFNSRTGDAYTSSIGRGNSNAYLGDIVDIFVQNTPAKIVRTVTLTKDECIWARFLRSVTPSTFSYNVSNIRVEEGNVSYGIKIPILSNSTTTNVYLGEVQSTRRIKKLVLTGEENWKNLSYGSAYLDTITDYSRVEGNISKCSHFLTNDSVKTADDAGNGITFYNAATAYYRMYLKDTTTFTTIDSLKAYLQQQYANGTPVCVWYVLAEPTTGIVNEPIRKIGDYADTVSGITIPTTAGADSFDVLTTLKPSEVTATYKGWHPVQSVHERESGAWT